MIRRIILEIPKSLAALLICLAFLFLVSLAEVVLDESAEAATRERGVALELTPHLP